jgi:repressor LexA
VSRGIQVIRPIGPLLETEGDYTVPLYGDIAAGEPIPIPQEDFRPEEYIEVTKKLLRVPPGSNLYALRVKGQSMIDALVDDGDVVVLTHQSTAESGDMVAAWIKSREEATLKRFYQSGEKVTLKPANPLMYSEEDIKRDFTFPATDVQIDGKVHLVLRRV